MLISRISAIYF